MQEIPNGFVLAALFFVIGIVNIDARFVGAGVYPDLLLRQRSVPVLRLRARPIWRSCGRRAQSAPQDDDTEVTVRGPWFEAIDCALWRLVGGERHRGIGIIPGDS